MKKFLLSMLAIFLVIGLASAGTFAWFQDTETSTGNNLVAGTFDLKVNDDNLGSGFGDGVTATWTMSDMIPGVTTVGPFNVFLQNSGSIAANHVEISFSHEIDEVTNPVESDTDPESTPEEMARWIEITSMDYTGVILTATLTDANGNGFLDLEDVTLPANAAALDNLSPPPINGGTKTFHMALKFNEGATNDIQGDILTSTVTFTLNQDISQ